jgi:hypothetical protein
MNVAAPVMIISYHTFIAVTSCECGKLGSDLLLCKIGSRIRLLLGFWRASPAVGGRGVWRWLWGMVAFRGREPWFGAFTTFPDFSVS